MRRDVLDRARDTFTQLQDTLGYIGAMAQVAKSAGRLADADGYTVAMALKREFFVTLVALIDDIPIESAELVADRFIRNAVTSHMNRISTSFRAAA